MARPLHLTLTGIERLQTISHSSLASLINLLKAVMLQLVTTSSTKFLDGTNTYTPSASVSQLGMERQALTSLSRISVT
jgi:hypothetical protein